MERDRVNLTVTSEQARRLFELAEDEGEPVARMVRRWVLERLKMEWAERQNQPGRETP